MKNGLLCLMLVCCTLLAYSQDTIMPLWPADKLPNSIPSSEQEIIDSKDIIRISKVQQPTIAVYLPSKANATGKAVLIFPGGGYHILAYDWEGTDIAKFLNANGVAGIVVKYRLPTSDAITEKHKVPLIDAQRAIKLVRANAEKWQISTDGIGIMGFSAGGHLASTLGTHYNENAYERLDAIDSISARPDFMALIYPVISFKDAAVHSGSRKALIGDDPSAALIAEYSNELHVNKSTPPTFLLHAADDTAVSAENSILFFRALQTYSVAAALHIYPKGGHGFSLALKDPYLRGWPERFIEWLEHLE